MLILIPIPFSADIREYGIKVCSIMPGFVNTPIIQHAKQRLDLEKCIQSEDIAQGVLYILRTPYNVCPTEIKYRSQYTPYLKYKHSFKIIFSSDPPFSSREIRVLVVFCF